MHHDGHTCWGRSKLCKLAKQQHGLPKSHNFIAAAPTVRKAGIQPALSYARLRVMLADHVNDTMTCSLSRLMGKRVSITERDRKYLQARGQHSTCGVATSSCRCMLAQVRLLVCFHWQESCQVPLQLATTLCKPVCTACWMLSQPTQKDVQDR